MPLMKVWSITKKYYNFEIWSEKNSFNRNKCLLFREFCSENISLNKSLIIFDFQENFLKKKKNKLKCFFSLPISNYINKG